MFLTRVHQVIHTARDAREICNVIDQVERVRVSLIKWRSAEDPHTNFNQNRYGAPGYNRSDRPTVSGEDNEPITLFMRSLQPCHTDRTSTLA